MTRPTLPRLGIVLAWVAAMAGACLLWHYSNSSVRVFWN